MRWIAGMVLGGWGGIVALAWWLADRRAHFGPCFYDTRCRMAAFEARDEVLIWGPAVWLLLAAGFAFALRRRLERLNVATPSRPSATPAATRLLR